MPGGSAGEAEEGLDLEEVVDFLDLVLGDLEELLPRTQGGKAPSFVERKERREGGLA